MEKIYAYGEPHPIHTVVHAERIVREAIPGLPLEAIGIEPGLIGVLEEDGIQTVGDLDNADDDRLYNMEQPIDSYDMDNIQTSLAKVGLSVEVTNTFHFGEGLENE